MYVNAERGRQTSLVRVRRLRGSGSIIGLWVAEVRAGGATRNPSRSAIQRCLAALRDHPRNVQSVRIEDGLSINARPDWTGVKEEYKIYGEMDTLSPEQRDELRLKSLQAGKISSNRLFFGVKRGVKDNVPYDDTGIFIKNKWGRAAIKLYVDNDNKPHFEAYDPLGKSITYELKRPRP